jgi:hypothetical protein
MSLAPYKLGDAPSGFPQLRVGTECRDASRDLRFSGSAYHVVIYSKKAFSFDR